MDSDRILIIGAGVGGLALAQGLKRAHIQCTVFERDTSLDSRLQGYRIKLVGDIQKKVRELLTDEAWAEFQATLATTVLGETTVNATDAGIIASRRGHVSPTPGAQLPWTIDRGMLRKAMSSGLEDVIHYGKQLVRYEVDEHGVNAFFADGSVERGSLLVGADGMRSVVRKQLLPDYRFVDTRTCCIYGKSIMTAELKERFPEPYRRWITVVLDSTPILQSIISGEKSMAMVLEPVQFIHRDTHNDLPDDYVHWGLLFNREMIPLGDTELEESLRSRPVQLSLDLTSEWHPSIRSLIELQEPSLTSGMRVYSASPEIPPWTPSSRVTVIGDAVHVMSPSGGVGAVAALHDSAALADIIRTDGISDTSIGQFEGKMRGFANVCIQRSFRAGHRLFGSSAFGDCLPVDV